MKKILEMMAVLILFAAMSCNTPESSEDSMTSIIDQTALDSATVLVADSTGYWFAHVSDAHVMLVYHDSLLIVSNSGQTYGKPIISIYDKGDPLHHLIDYIPRGSDIDEMIACRIQITEDELFVNDCYNTRRYCTIGLRKPLLPADNLHLSHSGVEDRGVAAIPFQEGLLVENPQCYANDEAGIYNDVPRLLHYRQGRCLTPMEPVTYQVADVNTGADIHYNKTRHRVCFVSHRQPLVEFYDDSLRLIHRLILQSEDAQNIHIGGIQTTMHQKRSRGETEAVIRATFDKTQRVVGAGNQLHAFLCSATDTEYIYLVYCGKRFSYDFHNYPTYILVLDWNGELVDTYRFDRWIQAISPSLEKGTFYLTVYADDKHSSAQMKLVKTIPYLTVEADSLTNEKKIGQLE